MLRADVDEHVLAVEVRLGGRGRRHRHGVAGRVDDERGPDRTTLGIEAGGGEGDVDRARVSHGHSPVRSPAPKRWRISGGRSSKASAMDSSSIE